MCLWFLRAVFPEPEAGERGVEGADRGAQHAGEQARGVLPGRWGTRLGAEERGAGGVEGRGPAGEPPLPAL